MADGTQIHEVPDDPVAAIEYCYEQGWTDGLPVVPPTPELVDAMLASKDALRRRSSPRTPLQDWS